MTIEFIHAYLVNPGRGLQDLPDIPHSRLSHEGKLFDLLNGIFTAEPDQKDIEVLFNPNQNGEQRNVCRQLILNHLADCSVETGLPIAQKLQTVTDNRSGMGLLFLINGTRGLSRKFIISRFAADSAILAELAENGLNVEFLDRVFVKKATAYKALSLAHENPNAGYWCGSATDRQISGLDSDISNYWISDFLEASFLTTPAAGTKRLANTLNKVVRSNPNLGVKTEIASAITLANGAFGNRQTNINEFCNHFGFSDALRQSIASQFKDPGMLTERFNFDAEEFTQRMPYRSIELDSGAILTAPTSEFDTVFTKTDDDNDINVVTYSTTGRVVNHRVMAKV